MTNHDTQRLTGVSLSPGAFRVQTVEGGCLPTGIIAAVQQATMPIVHVKQFLGEDQRTRLAANFDAAVAATGTERQDGVAGLEIGGTLFGKDPRGFLTASAEANPQLEALYAGAVHVGERLRSAVQRTLPQGCTVEPIEIDGRLGGTVRAVTWRGEGDYSLALHTDEEQFLCERVAGLPVHGSSRPIAMNVYPRAAGSSLRVYNIMPSRASKHAYGLVESLGYPIPEALVDGQASVDIPLEDGDLVIMLGSLVHGVPRHYAAEARQLFNSFLVADPSDPSLMYMLA